MLFPLSTFIMLTQTFKMLFFISILLVEVLFFNIDPAFASRAVIGALLGGLVLTYFDSTKPNRSRLTWYDAIIKTLLSASSSLFLSPAFIRYYEIVDLDYISFCYFIFALIALVILRAIHTITEQNAREMIINIVNKIFVINPQPNTNKEVKK